MKERKLFANHHEVRSILAGTQTMFRRVVKPQRHPFGHMLTAAEVAAEVTGETCAVRCPYGQPGDRLWVPETFSFTDAHMPKYIGSIEYRADNKCMAVDIGPVTVDVPHKCDPRPFGGPWSPSIRMPRWASRITLDVTGVRVERLQDISNEDCIAEGIAIHPNERAPRIGRAIDESMRRLGLISHYGAEYARLWASTNSPESWDANPWVWVVEFKRVEGGAHG